MSAVADALRDLCHATGDASEDGDQLWATADSALAAFDDEDDTDLGLESLQDVNCAHSVLDELGIPLPDSSLAFRLEEARRLGRLS